MAKFPDKKGIDVILAKNCECNDNRAKNVICQPSCSNCRHSDCRCDCCQSRRKKFLGGVAAAVIVFAAIAVIYYLVTHPLPDLQKAHDYFSKLLGTRKLRFISRSELDLPQITHITEEMDINPYSFFPSKDLM